MGGSSGSSNTQSNQTSTVQLPPWVNQAAQQNYGFAQGVANRPLVQYQGQQVANVGPQTNQAWNLAANSGNAGAAQYGAAQAGLMGILGAGAPQVAANQTYNSVNPGSLGSLNYVNPTSVATQPDVANVSAGQLSNTNLQPYMNPYTQSVINQTLPIMQQNLALSQNQQQNAANSANAFGGSRQGIQQGVTQAQGAMGMGQMAAQLNQANYAQAQAAGEYDISNQLQAGLANQQTGLAERGQDISTLQGNQQTALQAGEANLTGGLQARGQNLSALQGNQQAQLTAQGQALSAMQGNQQAGINQQNLALQAAGGMANLGNVANANVLQNYSMLSDAGQQEQTQAQNQINAQMNQFNQAWNYPTSQLGILQSALGMTPYGQTQTTQGQQSTQTQYSPDFAQSALGLLSTGASLFAKSDKKIKKNIKRIGTHPPSGLPTYSFNFKGEPKGMPKTTGPIAQDVEKKYPAAVANIRGIKHVMPSRIPGGGGMLSASSVMNRSPSPQMAAPARMGMLAPANMGGMTPQNQIPTPLGPARQARDGRHYVQHPQTGKFFRVKRAAYG